MNSDIAQAIKNCRVCGSNSLSLVLKLKDTALSDVFYDNVISSVNAPLYPLTLVLCQKCNQLQLQETILAEVLYPKTYPYRTGVSQSQVSHFKAYAENVINLYALDSTSIILDIGSNDSTFLFNFSKNQIGVVGIDPTYAAYNEGQFKKHIVYTDFFNKASSLKILKNHGKFDVITLNNVISHIDNVIEVIECVRLLIKENGHVIVEIPLLSDLIQNGMFEYIFHQHIYYYSLESLLNLFKRFGFHEKLIEHTPNQGGSARIHFSIKEYNYEEVLFQSSIENINTLKSKMSSFISNCEQTLKNIRKNNSVVVGFGAAGKSLTLINQLGVQMDYFNFLIDGSKTKQNKYLGGTNYHVLSPTIIHEFQPDVIIILVRNLNEEITKLLRNEFLFLNKIYAFNELGLQEV